MQLRLPAEIIETELFNPDAPYDLYQELVTFLSTLLFD
jgi:hypothetical protein